MYLTNKNFGLWSLVGTYLLIAYIALQMGAIGTVTDGMLTLFTGSILELQGTTPSFYQTGAAVLAVVALELPFTLLAAIFVSKMIGEGGKHSLVQMFADMTEGSHFYTSFVLVIIEEVLARGIFLWLLPQFEIFSGALMFYLLIVVGNGLWALLHLMNFTAGNRHPLRVLPQFVAGLFFTYIFVEFGFVAAVLAHFVSNAIIFAVHKIQKVSIIDVMIVGYAAISAAISYSLMDKPLSDISIWFTDNPTFELIGWDLWDYLQLSVFTSSVITVITGTLLYDRRDIGKDDDTSFWFYLLAIPLMIVLMWGLYLLLGLVIDDIPYRILTLSVLFAFLGKTASGSAMAHMFWSGVPGLYITMCLLLALGVWVGIAWLTLSVLISTPYMFLSQYND